MVNKELFYLYKVTFKYKPNALLNKLLTLLIPEEQIKATTKGGKIFVRKDGTQAVKLDEKILSALLSKVLSLYPPTP